MFDIPIKEYEALSGYRRSILKQFSAGFELPDRPVPVDPYIYGAWLGDGSTTHPILHTPRGPMADAWVSYFRSQGGDVAEYYKKHVIGGFGSFAKVAESFEAFPAMIKSKLVTEISMR